MTEEVVPDNTPVENTTAVETNTPAEVTYSPLEQRALEMGWRPKTEFSGDDEDFVDAKEFVGRKPLYDKLSQQSKELKNIKSTVAALQDHYNKVQETEYNRALKALKNERKSALSEGDADRFDALDDEIKIVEKQFEIARQTKQVQEATTREVPPEFAAWQQRNPWYGTTKYMRDFADSVGAKLAGSMPPGEVLKQVEQAVKAEFPQKFTNPNKANAPDVSSPKTASKGKGNTFTLSETERTVMNKLVRGGYITEAAYIADLKKMKEIE